MNARLLGLLLSLGLLVFGGVFDRSVAEETGVVVAAPGGMVQNWTGFYAGISGGYHFGDITQHGCTGACATNPTLSGGTLALQLGYDMQFDNHVVLGVLGYVPVLWPTNQFSVGGGVFKVKPEYALIVAPRIGYAFNNILPYAFAGVEIARVKVNDSFGPSPSNTHVGLATGLGLEYAFARHWSFDAKYAFTYLPKKQYNFGGGFEEYGENSNNLLFGVNYRF
jgi:outer membrane immunogenic protein